MILVAIVQKLSHIFAILWILANVIFTCQPEHKRISENVTFSCSSQPITEPIVWRFNNQSQINSSSVVVHGTSIVILSHKESVYGNYSCLFTNGTLISCFSLYVQGMYFVKRV